MRGGGRVESLQAWLLDRLSSLTVCRREIGKQKDAGSVVGMSKPERPESTTLYVPC